MLYESQDHLWKHVLCHTHQLSWSTRSPSSCIRSMLTTIKIKCEHYYYYFSHPATKSTFSHNTWISAVTCSASLRLEHVVIVTFVVTVSKTFGTERHALRDAAGLTSVGHKVGGPDQAAHHSVVVLLDIVTEVIWSSSSSHQPSAPINCITIIDVFFRVEQMIQQGLKRKITNCFKSNTVAENLKMCWSLKSFRGLGGGSSCCLGRHALCLHKSSSSSLALLDQNFCISHFGVPVSTFSRDMRISSSFTIVQF